MAATVATVALSITSTGGIGPSGPITLAGIPVTMNLVQEIEAIIQTTDVAVAIAIPPIGATQAMIYVQTDQPVSMKINAETVARKLLPPLGGSQPGVYLCLGGPLTAQLVFDGDGTATGPAHILILIGGN